MIFNAVVLTKDKMDDYIRFVVLFDPTEQPKLLKKKLQLI